MISSTAVVTVVVVALVTRVAASSAVAVITDWSRLTLLLSCSGSGRVIERGATERAWRQSVRAESAWGWAL
jgi:hypothetical protein